MAALKTSIHIRSNSARGIWNALQNSEWFCGDSKLNVAWYTTVCSPSSYVYYQRANHETVSRYRRV